MSKEADISISVTVKDGPKMQPQSTKLPKDYCGFDICKAINEEVILTPENCECWVALSITSQAPQQQQQQKPVQQPSTPGRELAFVAIHADHYKYKDSCGKEFPGIIYAKTKAELANKFEYLDGPHVYVSRKLQPLDAKHIWFRACKELFACITNPEMKKVVINVTYGVGEPNSKTCPDCETCDAPAGTGNQNGRGTKDQQYPVQDPMELEPTSR
ncbi:hypothetical protein RMSM_05737 [Rhodopirellula maiorica SM1]|uniref:Uncharacterized protein n=1 Tax=Rhodopirellula maiorica SM1 TaxID=1265738 RepID=M5RTR6_9BACT|nr:hypothetical protein [Rhodopirellula maiorica]EMI17344.1 hypothetical protein RMSM_05737 [Rhodopirellula maiorica SM1]